jgi:hypothetical protein
MADVILSVLEAFMQALGANFPPTDALQICRFYIQWKSESATSHFGKIVYWENKV